MAEDGHGFSLEGCKAFLIGFHCLRIVLQADTALIGENSDSVTKMLSIFSYKRLSFLLQSTHPSACNCLRVLGTHKCHHFQSFASLAKTLPDAVCIRVESSQNR